MSPRCSLYRKCLYTKQQHFKNTSIIRRYKLTAMSLDSHGRQVPAFKNASVHIQNTHILKAPAFPDVTSQLLCLLTVTVDRWRHLKNTSILKMLAFVYKTLAFPDVTSQPLCPLTVTVNRSQHIKNESVCIQNNNILKTPALSDVAS